MAAIQIEFIGSITTVDESITFGRSGEIAVDDANSFMHRVVGEFRVEADVWWLHNRGSSIRLVMFGSDGVQVDLPAGTSTALTAHTGTVSFMAGPSPYELTYRLESAPEVNPAPIGADTGTGTSPFGVTLTAREVDYMVAFAEPRLTGSGDPFPTYLEVARANHVAEKTVDNSLQKLRAKLKASGVTGIDNLDGLVTHLLANGRITMRHLLDRRLRDADNDA